MYDKAGRQLRRYLKHERGRDAVSAAQCDVHGCCIRLDSDSGDKYDRRAP